MSIIADADLDCLEFDMSLDKVTLCRALTFNERAELLRQAVDAPAVDVALAKQRLQRWTSQRPFEDASLFLRRLDADHLSADEFEHVLGLNEQALGRMSFDTPQWAQAIEPNLARLSPHADWSQSKGFADVVAPLVHDACDIVHDSLATLFSHAHVRVVDLKVIEDQLLAELHSTLRGIFTKTMVLELNVARVQGQLTGDTPEARFWSFVARLHEPIVVRALIDEYPVMFRLLAEAVARWTRISTEPLQRLCTDWHAIRAQFCDGDVPGALVKLRTGLGTARVGGRSVAIFTFESGFRVVYKPKSMSAELHFQELLAWMNERGAQPTFRPLRILDRGSHSWMEWVQATTCKSPQQVAHFYRRQGAYLGLLYALDATDFHQDNLIAADEHPLLIDLEALFHPHSRANADIDADADAPAQSLEGALQRVLSHSVLRTSLLPRPEIANDESDGYDDSGLTGSGTTLTPYEVSTWDNVWTDEMKLVRKRVQASSADNLPTLDGAPIDVLAYYDDIVSGFESSYRLLLRHRSALLAADGPLARFADDDTRVMLHSNDTYDRLLSNSTHPDLLRDALDRDRYLDRLWVAAAEDARMVDVIPLETRDLLVGDMPVFAARPGSRDLFAGDGQRIDEFFQCSGLEVVRARIGRMGEEDLAQQTWFVRAALATRVKGVATSPSQIHPTSHSHSPSLLVKAGRSTTLNAARKIGTWLCDSAVRTHDEASWVGLQLEDARRWSIAPLGHDLYNGLPGVALFLAHLGALSRERRFTDLARAAIAGVQRVTTPLPDDEIDVGALSGLGGSIYALVHLGLLWRDQSLIQHAEAMVNQLPRPIDAADSLHIHDGVAGCLVGFAALHRVVPSKQVHELIARCAARLAAHVDLSQPQPSTGFARGLSGISFALLRAFETTGERRWLDASLDAVAQEHALLQRPHPNETVATWQNGAAGIGLARIALLQSPMLSGLDTMTRGMLHSDLCDAVSMTEVRGFGHNHSLAHGDLGSLELIWQARVVLPGQSYSPMMQEHQTHLLSRLFAGEWATAAPTRVETPGLFTGLAGIGYGLLRMFAPTRVPCVLTFDLPNMSGC